MYADQLVEERQVVEQARRRRRPRGRARPCGFFGRIPVVLALDEEELGLDPEVELQAVLREPGRLAPQDPAAVHRVRLVVEVEIAGRPRDGRLPRQDRDGVEVGPHGQLVVGRALPEAVDRRAGEQLGAAHHPREVLDRHGLGLRHAVDVGVGRQAVAHAVGVELLAAVVPRLVDLTARGHDARVARAVLLNARHPTPPPPRDETGANVRSGRARGYPRFVGTSRRSLLGIVESAQPRWTRRTLAARRATWMSRPSVLSRGSTPSTSAARCRR